MPYRAHATKKVAFGKNPSRSFHRHIARCLHFPSLEIAWKLLGSCLEIAWQFTKEGMCCLACHTVFYAAYQAPFLGPMYCDRTHGNKSDILMLSIASLQSPFVFVAFFALTSDEGCLLCNIVVLSSNRYQPLYQGVCGELGWVGFLVVCFLYKINPKTTKK